MMKWNGMLCLVSILVLMTGPGYAKGEDGEEEGMEYLWTLGVPGTVMDVTVNYLHVYLACNTTGLQIVSLISKAVIGSYDSPGLSYGIAVQGTHAYLADWDNGLVILDISDPTNPELTGRIDTNGYAFKVNVRGDHAFVCDWDAGLAIIDISDPSHPVEVGRFSNVDHATDCSVLGDLVYLVDWWGLRIVDVMNPAVPVELGNLTTGGYAYGVDLIGDIAYVADDFRGMRVIDVSDPTDPVEIGRYIPDGDVVHARVDGAGEIAYLAVYDSGIVALDISNPADPTEVANFTIAGQNRRIWFEDDEVFTASGDGGMWVVSTYKEPGPDEPDPLLLYLFLLLIPIVAVLIPAVDHVRGKKRMKMTGSRGNDIGSEGSEMGRGIGGGMGTGTGGLKDGRPHGSSLGGSFDIPESHVIGANTILGRYLASHGLPPSLDERTIDHVRRIMGTEAGQELPPGRRFDLFLAMKQLSYLLHPNNEWLRDLFHNHRESLKFDSYFEMPGSPVALLRKWGLPPGLRGNVHLDREREEIVERIGLAPHPENFVIIGAPGVGKTALLFQVFDGYMRTGNGSLMSLAGTGNRGEYRGVEGSRDREMSRGREGMNGNSRSGVNRNGNFRSGVNRNGNFSSGGEGHVSRPEHGGEDNGKRTFHEHHHIRLFIDDIPEEPKLVRSIMEHGTRGLVVSAREGDWNGLPYEFQRMFTRLTIKDFTPHDLEKVCRKLLRLTSIEADDDAHELLVEYADGSPIFVWTLLDQVHQSGQRRLTSSFIRENASRGMLNYLGDILMRLLRDPAVGGGGSGGGGIGRDGEGGRNGGGRYGGAMGGRGFRKGGFHGLAMLYFLAAHMEGKQCSTVLFNRVSEHIARELAGILDDRVGMDPKDPGRALRVLSIQNDMIRFPHDFWVDVVLGKGDRNPFARDIVLIREKLSDTGIFEQAKRAVLSDSWNQVLARYRRNPGTTRDAVLAFFESILSNFTIHELKELGVDIETMREIAALYSHLPEGDAILTRIERVAPLPTQQYIEIKDSVIMKSTIG